MAKKKDKGNTPTIENRRARYDYFIEDTLEVGISLLGSEVKSIRDGGCSLAEGYVTAEAEPLSLSLHSINIARYDPAGPIQHDPRRVRRLLAHKSEIRRLARQVDQKGITIVPLSLYFKGGIVKIKIGLARGKQRHDKRASIADRESERDLRREMSQKHRW